MATDGQTASAQPPQAPKHDSLAGQVSASSDRFRSPSAFRPLLIVDPDVAAPSNAQDPTNGIDESATSAREPAPSLRSTFATCCSTVRGDKNSTSAICRLV